VVGVRGRNDRSPEKKALVLQALADTGGQVNRACEAASIGVSTFYDWKHDEPHFAAAVQAAIDGPGTDTLEAEAIRRALAGSDTLIIFLLKARVPDRYREKQQVYVSLNDATADQIQNALDKLSESQLRAIIAKRNPGADGTSGAG